MTSLKLNWLAAVAMLAVPTMVTTAFGQDSNAPGIVRISDSKPRVVAQPASFHGHRQGAVYHDGGSCPTGECQNGNCQNGHGCFGERYCGKNSPDHGYSPPAKYPLHRRSVQYTTMFPNQWYGLPGSELAGGYPMVYQATDTTQLGYYYQHTPTWQPNRNMMPQRPVPAQWHIVAPPYHLNLFANQGGMMGAGYGVQGYCPPQQQGVPAQPGAPQPVDNMNGAPAPIQNAPAPAAGLPPSPREIQNSAESDHIRRAAF
jgi:hypothetical protein